MKLKALFSIFRMKTAEGFQYRLAGIAGATTSIFWVLVEITVYRVFYTYANNNTAGILAGLTLNQLISYSWLTQLLFLMQPMSIDSDIQSKIESGNIALELCRPLDLYTHWFAKLTASRLTPLFWRGSLVILVGMLMPASYRLGPPASLINLILMLLSFFSALFLCTTYGVLMCVVRMGITWGNGPTYMLMLIGGVLSGAYLPLQLWPDSWQRFLLLQPFAGYLDIPLRLYVGSMSPQTTFAAITLQWVWTLIFILLGKFLLVRRLKTIVVQGG